RIEAFYWLLRRDGILLEEEQRKNRELQRAEEKIASSRLDAAEKLRTDLASLLLSYEELERQVMAKGVTQELRNKQTSLHNMTLPIIEKGLGIDYWAQFKSVQEVPPNVPTSFVQETVENRSLLYAIRGRKMWLSRTIE